MSSDTIQFLALGLAIIFVPVGWADWYMYRHSVATYEPDDGLPSRETLEALTIVVATKHPRGKVLRKRSLL